MAKRNIVLSDDLYCKLTEYSKIKGVPIISLIREACEEYLEKHAPQIYYRDEDLLELLKSLKEKMNKIYELTGEYPPIQDNIKELLSMITE